MFYHKVQNDVMQVLCLLIITQIRKAAWRILTCQPTDTELRRNLTKERWKCHHYKGLPKEGVGDRRVVDNLYFPVFLDHHLFR